MTKFCKKVITAAIYIMSLVFAFVPESFFDIFKIFPDAPTVVNVVLNRSLSFLIVVTLVAVVYAIYLRCRRSVYIKGKNYSIKISYGDIFDVPKSKKVIPFDECFTTEVGHNLAQIKPNSICGQYLTRCSVPGIPSIIANAQIKPCEERSKYKDQVRYQSGRLVPNGEYLLMAFAKLDEDGLGRMTRDEYLESLSVLWREIDKHYGQIDVCIPILGSGITRMGDNELTQQELLDMIIGSYKLSAHKIKAPARLHIVCRRCEGFSLRKIGEHL